MRNGWILGFCLGLVWAVAAPCRAQEYFPSAEGRQRAGFREVFVAVLTEVSVMRYHNLMLLPQEMVMSWGGAVYAPVLRSGDMYSLGFMTEVKYGASLTLNRVRLISVPLSLAVRFGGGNQADSEHKIGGGVGIGLDMYRYLNTEYGPSFHELRPVLGAELSWQRGWFRAFVRVGQTFTSRNFTRYFFSFGSEIPIDFSRNHSPGPTS